MQLVYRFIGRHTPEVLAIFFAASSLLIGSYTAWKCEAMWLNRTGSLIVIVGVLLAASRFHEWVRAKVATFIEQNYDSIIQSAINTVERDSAPLTGERRSAILAEVQAETLAELDDIFDGDKRRIKNLEVILVILGTFLNGFGDYLISLLKSHVT